MNVKERMLKASGRRQMYFNLSVWSLSRATSVHYMNKARKLSKELHHLRKESHDHRT